MSRAARDGAPAGGLASWLPGLTLARSYRIGNLRYDIVAGVVLAALLVPQGMAYAELAGLPPVTGLYATLVPLLVYAVVGPSRILILGPDSAVSPMVAAAIVPLALPGEPSERIALAGMLALLVGVLFVVGGIAKFGFVTDLLSKPVRLGYLMGIAVTVIVAQLPKLFGFSVGADDLVGGLEAFVRGLDETNGTALAIGAGSLAAILGVRRLVPPLPGVLIVVVGATVATALLDLEVPVVGVLPSGLPSPSWPGIDAADLGKLALAAVGVAFVAFADTSVLSRSYAGRLHEEVDQNRELVALGAANVATGFFQGFPISSSSSRTAVAETIGARTQLAGVVGAGALAIVLVLATGLLADLPSAVLAAVVIAAVLSLIDVAGLRLLLHVRRADFELALVSFLGVAITGVLWGIGIAIAVSLLAFVRRAWRPHDAVLGRVPGVKGYHDLARHPDAVTVPGLVLYRFDAPLFFANADHFRSHVLRLVREAEEPVRWVVVAAEPITDVDSTAAEMLHDLDRELDSQGTELAFAELKGHVRDRLAPYGLVERIGRQRFYPTIGTAVKAYVATTGVPWRDWEDEPERPPG